MAANEIFNEHNECFHDCSAVYDFLKLTDELVKTIIELDEELIRWRQALIKYLTPEWAEGLRQDILNNTSRDFEGEPAYDLYVKLVCGGIDPQQVDSRIERIQRLIKGIDETSITYL